MLPDQQRLYSISLNSLHCIGRIPLLPVLPEPNFTGTHDPITALAVSSVSDECLFPAVWVHSNTLFTIPNPLKLLHRG
jgi:hypothetical protein